MLKPVAKDVWPAKDFRENQEDVMEACIQAFESGYKNVILDAPVGSGKSLHCTGLIRYADNGFYTTPQKSLRQQVQDDTILEPYVEDLKARRDYTCSVTGSNCKDCSIYNSNDRSCAEEGCNYWRRKQSVMASDIAVITFSMLIVDSMIPTFMNDVQISFDDRDLIAIDEAHNLVEQTREMHAGFDVSPYGMPSNTISHITSDVSWDASEFSDVRRELLLILSNLKSHIPDIPYMEMSAKEQRCKTLAEKIQRAEEEVSNGNPWVVDVEGMQYKGDYVKKLMLRPINVSGFLNNFVWSRANKRLISTATLRHRNNPDIWIKQAGLNPDETKVISVGMTFPAKNRPVITDEMVCSMKGGGDEDNWDSIMLKLDDLANRYYNEKGICHTSSYDRAVRVGESIDKDKHPYLHDNVFIHEGNLDATEAIEQWQDGDKDLICSPSMMEGIDLKGDLGRYNILMKVPYPSHDSWTSYLLEETDYGWNDYFDRAAIRVAQAYGRTTRSKDDYSDFYVLDKDYKKLKKRAKLPEWMLEAEGYVATGERSIFDY